MPATYIIRQIQTGWQFLEYAEYSAFREALAERPEAAFR
jgi:hypothetical protein